MSISRFWHYQQLMLQLQMAIWKLAPSIYVLPVHVDMVVSSQVYIYLLRFIDPSCNPHLSLMSMYRRTLTSLNWRWPYMAQVNFSNPARKFGVSPIFIYFRHWHWYQQTANQHGSLVLVKYFKPEYCTAITALHIFTRCDSTSVSKGIGKLKPIKMLKTHARFQSILFYLCPCWGVGGYSKSPGRTWWVHLCHVWSASIKICQCSCDTCSSRGVGYTMGL